MKLGERVGRTCIRGGHYVRSWFDPLKGMGMQETVYASCGGIYFCNLGNTLQRGIEITRTRILLKRERISESEAQIASSAKFSPVTSFHSVGPPAWHFIIVDLLTDDVNSQGIRSNF
jgi:hypothetical protein